MEYAYIRVSTVEQNANRQLDAISTLNIPSERIYMDKLSGKNFERPEWKRLKKSSAAAMYFL
jgi:DNA invertase Pin-like site-specific DNA recombinase